MDNKVKWILGCAAGFFVVLLSHTSSRPQVFSRYSLLYFSLLVAYSGTVVGLFLLYRSRYWQRAREALLTDSAVLLAALSRQSAQLIVGLHILHWVLVLIYLSPFRVFSGEPILQADYSHHFHQVSNVVEALASEGRHWAMDPSFCAGYPLGTIFDVDMKLFEVLAFLLTRLGVDLATAYNSLILAYFLSVPTLLTLSCRNFGFSPLSTISVLLMGVLIWHSDETLLHFNSVGMCSFVLATYWSLLTASLLHRFLSGGGGWVYSGFLIALSISLPIHITTPFLLAGSLVPLVLERFRRISVTRHALIALAIVLAAAANAWWIETVFRFYSDRVVTAFGMAPSISEFVEGLLVFRSDRLILALLGLWGYALHWKTARPIAIVGLVAIPYFYLLANLTVGLPLLNTLEPARFMVPCVLFSAIGLAIGVASQAHRFRLRQIDWQVYFPILLLVFFFCGRLLTPRSLLSPAFRSSPGDLRPLAEWIQAETTRDGRIAFLDASPGYLTGAKLRFYVDREFIGGPFSQMNLQHSYASFTPFRFFDKPLVELSQEQLARYVELYNIKWLITSTDESCSLFKTLAPTATLVETLTARGSDLYSMVRSASPFMYYRVKKSEARFCIFDVARPSSFLLDGTGQVEAELNRIRVTGASPGRVILKYHWLDTLAVKPPLPIRKYPIEESPIGFIEVENGTISDFVVYNSYEYPRPLWRELFPAGPAMLAPGGPPRLP